jgi:AcrR family transcriptional regulator
MLALANEDFLKATIAECAGNRTNVFSTKAIASRLGVSEFAIYDRFGSKTQLLYACENYIGDGYDHFAIAPKAKEKDLMALLNGILDHFLEDPQKVAFMISYSHLFPRVKDTYEDDQHFEKAMRETGRVIFKGYFDTSDDQAISSIFIYSFRFMLSLAQNILLNEVRDTPEIRKIAFGFLLSGFKGYSKVSHS